METVSFTPQELYTRKKPPHITGYNTEQAPELIWTWWPRQKSYLSQ